MILKSKTKDVKIVINKSFFDKRGYFKELLKEKDLNVKFYFWLCPSQRKMLYEVCTYKQKFSRKICKCN